MPNPKDNSAFGDKKYLNTREFREWLKRHDLYGFSGMSEQDRLSFEEEMRKSYGSYLDKGEVMRTITRLRTEKNKSLVREERQKIDRKTRLLRKLLGD